MAKKPTKAAVKLPRFMSLADFAKLTKRTEEEIMTYVKSGVISTKGYCYPIHFGNGKDIAFLPAKALVGFVVKEDADKKDAETPTKEKPVKEKSKSK